MGRRASKKDKEITLVDVKEPNMRFYKQRNTLWGERFKERSITKRVQNLIDSFDRLKIEVKGYCAICWDPLTNDFPDDFPDEFKFCCMCKYIAKHIAYGESPEKYRMFDEGTEDGRSFKIQERITLVEGNDR